MATSHLCRNRPGFKEGSDPWVDGPVAGCPHHDQRGRRQPKVKGIIGKKEARAMDRAAGTIGTDRGDYISGT